VLIFYYIKYKSNSIIQKHIQSHCLLSINIALTTGVERSNFFLVILVMSRVIFIKLLPFVGQFGLAMT
jgi:hypothetical protein